MPGDAWVPPNTESHKKQKQVKTKKERKKETKIQPRDTQSEDLISRKCQLLAVYRLGDNRYVFHCHARGPRVVGGRVASSSDSFVGTMLVLSVS